MEPNAEDLLQLKAVTLETTFESLIPDTIGLI